MMYENVREFTRALLEYEIAIAAGWQSLVPVSDVAKLGAMTFGPGYEKYRRAVEHIVGHAAAGALGIPLAPDPVRDLEADRDLTPETAAAMRQYAEAIAAQIVERQRKQNGVARSVETASAPKPPPHATPKIEEMVTAAMAREVAKLEKIRHAEVPATVTVVETRNGEAVDVRAVVKAEVAAFHRTMHRGVWQEGAHYTQGCLVTSGGSTWSCQRDGAQGRPGESPDFLLVVKRGADGRK